MAGSFEAVNMKHYETGQVGYLGKSKYLSQVYAAYGSNDTINDTETPTNEEKQEDDVEFLVDINRVVLILCVYCLARDRLHFVMIISAQLKGIITCI